MDSDDIDPFFFYAAAEAYRKARGRKDYMEMMKDYTQADAMLAWYAIDAYVDLYEG